MLPQGMDLEFKIKDSAAKPQVVRVAFDPPLTGYEEVKPRLLGMKADADEALGTVRDPFAPLPTHPHRTRSPPPCRAHAFPHPTDGRHVTATNCFTNRSYMSAITGQSPSNHAL